jgi:uncharacterized protein YhaN
LNIKPELKNTLLQHIFAKVEPFFHAAEKQMDYRAEVEHALLKCFMGTKLSDMSFDDIISILDETLNSEKGYRSESVDQVGSRVQIKAY